MIVAALILMLPFCIQNQWTVDDNGPADFPSIAAAIPAVGAGDILLVEPGSYGSFTLDKRLSIIGATGGPRPAVSGESLVSGAGNVTLAGLDFFELIVEDVPGRATITDCEIGHASIGGPGSFHTFLIEGCAHALVSNSTLLGAQGDETTFVESPGVAVHASAAALVECTIQGGKGANGGTTGFPGESGIEVEDGSLVIVAGCTVTGGNGGTGIELCQSPGGSAIETSDSTVIVRGSNGDVLDGGLDCPSSTDSFTISGSSSTVTVSGVTLDAPAFGPGLTLILPFPDEPYITIGGNTAPGGVRTLNVFAPSAQMGLVFVSLQPALLTTPKVLGGPLWFDPGSVLAQFAVVTVSQEVPATVPFVLPGNAAFAGLATVFQAFFSAPAGKFQATNPADVTLRF